MSDNTNKGEILQKIEQLTTERDAMAANLVEHLRLHIELNAILHPDGNGPSAPSLCDLVNYVRSDRQELAATVEASKELLRCWQTWLGASREQCDDSGQTLWDKIETICTTTPQQHLRHIRAEAGRAGFIAGSEQTAQFITGQIDYVLPLLDARADQYAERVKDGEV